MASPTASPADTGLACLKLLAQFHERPFNADQLRHDLAIDGPFSDEDILRAFKRLDLKASWAANVDWLRLTKMALPAIAKMQDGSYIAVAKLAPDKVLVHDPKENKPTILSKEAFTAAFSGQMLLVTRRAWLQNMSAKFDVRWFIPEIWKHRKLFKQVLWASFFIQIIALITPLFFQVVIDKVLVHHSWRTLDVLVVGLVVVNLFEAATQALRAYVLAHTTSRIDVTLGARLFQHLMNLPLAYFEARRIGDTVARVRELDGIRQFLTGSALTAALDAVFMVVFLAVMYSYAPSLTWVVIASMPLYVALCVLVSPILKSRVEEQFRRNADNQSFLVESINGLETIKASAIEPQFRRRWEEQLAAYVQSSFRAVNLNSNASQLVQLISKLTNAIILWMGASHVIDGQMTVGMLVAFNMLSGQVVAPILRLAQLWQEFQQVGVSIERLGDVLNTRGEVNGAGALSNLPSIKGDVTLEHITFRYQPDTSAVLDNVSLTVKAGEVIGLVGPSGSGKSTLTKLVQRMYVPEKGRVLVDGLDIGRVEPNWLRRQIGVVLQENFLFNRTIRENIALANPAAPLERVMQAAELAGAHEFISRLPDGYDTMVGERGCTLSGGQKQRIAIARALIGNPRILIFDEATSALDYESEHIIQTNMQRICRGRTVFIIAHRLSTVRQATRIVVMDKGRIVEEGTHEQLVAKENGAYQRLYQLQLGHSAPAARPVRRKV